MKRKLLKFLSKAENIFMSLLMLFSCVNIAGIQPVFALSSISKVSSSTVFDSQYGFSYRFIPGVTKAEPFGMTNNEDDWWSTNGTVGDPNAWEHVRVTSDSQKGKIGAWYRNVGTYQGKIIDLKMTIADWGERRTTHSIIDGQPNYPTIKIGTTSIIVGPQTNSFKDMRVTYEFYEHNTNNRIYVEGHANLYDVDYYENATLSDSNIVRGYVSENTNLVTEGAKVGCPKNITSGNGDRKNWCTVFVEGTSIDLIYNRDADELDYTTRYRTFYNFGFNGNSVSPFNTPDLLKSTSKTVIGPDETYNYSFDFNVPYQPAGEKYTSFKINDTLDNSLEVVSGSLNVTNDEGANVTNYFTLSQSGQTVTVDASKYINNGNFYTKSYKVTFTVKPKSGYNFTPSGGKINISNNATITTNQGTKTSNTVNTEVRFKITTSASNATITNSMNDIPGGASRSVTWKANEGYYISSVKIDGREVMTMPTSYNRYRGDTVTFDNIKANHTVEVVALPCFKITTSIVKMENATSAQTPAGKIDSAVSTNPSTGAKTVTSQSTGGTLQYYDPYENANVNYVAPKGYYVAWLEVDGQRISVSSTNNTMNNVYEFPRMQESHNIKVVCLPLIEYNGKLVTTAKIDENDTGGTISISTTIFDAENGTGDYETSTGQDQTLEGIIPGTDASASWIADEDYYVSKITVNDREMTVDDFVRGEWIDKITSDCTVVVSVTPKPLVTTQIVNIDGTPCNGTITPSQRVYPGENLSVFYTPQDGYYIKRVLVDGKEVADFNPFNDFSNLDNISSDRNVYVECEKIPQLTISKTADKDKYNINDKIHYTLTVNETLSYADDVIIRDDGLDESVSLITDSIAVSGTQNYKILENDDRGFTIQVDRIEKDNPVTVEYDVEIINPHKAGQTVYNNAVAYTDMLGTHHEVNADETVEILKPQLTIEKSQNNSYFNYLDTIHYYLKVNQTVEGAIAYDVNVEDYGLPEGVEVVTDSIQTNGNIVKSGNDGFTINFTSLAYNQQEVIEFDAKIVDASLCGKTIQNLATVKSKTDTTTTNTTTEADVLKPELVITKTADKDYYNVEQIANYTIGLSQSVENAIAYNVTIKDVAPTKGIKIINTITDPIKVSGISPDNYTLDFDEENNSFTLKIKKLTHEDNVTITYKAYIESNDLAGGNIENTVIADSDNSEQTDKITTVTPILKPALEVQKISDEDIEKYNVGDKIKYTITVKQTEVNAIANNVVITDKNLSEGVQLDLNTIAVEGLDSQQYTINRNPTNGEFSVHIKTLNYGTTVTITVEGTIISNDLAGNIVENTVSASCSNNTDYKDNPVEDTVEDPVYLPELTVEKTSDKTKYNVNDIVKYAIDVHQTVEGARANNVTITDIIDNGLAIDYDSISIEGMKINEDYTIEKTENGFKVVIKYLTDSCTVTYNARVMDNELAGRTDVNNHVEVGCDNHPTEPVDENNPDGPKLPLAQDDYTITVLKPKLTIQKIADRDKYNIGDTVHYQLVVGLSDESDAEARANNVVITDAEYTTGLVIDEKSIQVTAPNDCNAQATFTTDKAIQVTADKLNHGQTIVIEFNALVEDANLAMDSNEISNTAQVTCRNNPEIVKATVKSEILMPVLTIDKNSGTTGDEKYNIEDDIPYTISVTQTVQDAVANSVMITDEDISNGADINKDSIQVTVPEGRNYEIVETRQGFYVIVDKLGYNEIATVTFTAHLSSNKLAGQKVKNTATTTCTNNTAIVEDSVENKVYMPEFFLAKTAESEVNVKDTIHYNITVNQTVDGAKALPMTIKDEYPAGIEIDYSTLKVVKTTDGVETNITKQPDEWSYTVDEQSRLITFKINSVKDSVEISFEAKVTDNNLAGTTITNKANVVSENSEYTSQDEMNTYVLKPTLDLTKTTDKDKYNVGEDVIYTLTLKHSQDSDKNSRANNVVITDTKLTEGLKIQDDSIQAVSSNGEAKVNASRTSDGIIVTADRLEFEDTITVTFKAKVEDAKLANQTIKNEATATCENNPEVVNADVENGIYKPVLTITKSSDKDDYNVGDTTHYVIEVNQIIENAVANDVVIADEDMTEGLKVLPETIQVTNATLSQDANGDGFTVTKDKLDDKTTIKIEFDAIIESNDLTGGNIYNKATATSSNNPETVEATVEDEVLNPELIVYKEADKPRYNIGDRITYKIRTIQSVEGARSNDVQVTDILPKGITVDYDSFMLDGEKVAQENITITEEGFTVNIGDVTSVKTLTFQAVADDITIIENGPATVINNVKAYSPNTPNIDEKGATVEIEKPILSIEKTVTDEQPEYNLGDSINYHITVRQTAEWARANDIRITDFGMSDGVTIDMDSIQATSEGHNVEVIKNDDNTFEVLVDELEYNETVNISFQATVTSEAMNGEKISNSAKATCSNNPQEVQDTVEVQTVEPELQISKTADKDKYNYLETIHYTITVNQMRENAVSKNTIIKDTLPSGLTVDTTSFKVDNQSISADEIVFDNQTFTVNVGDVIDTKVLTFDAKVTDKVIEGTVITNIASVTSDNSEQEPQDSVDTEIYAPDVTIVKSAQEKQYNVGDEVVYIIRVQQNTAGAIADKVIINDTVPEGMTVVSAHVADNDKTNDTVEINGNACQFTVNRLQTQETLYIVAKITEPTLAGNNVTNIATATSDEDKDIPDSSTDIQVMKPQFDIQIDTDKEIYNVGDTIHYTITANQNINHAKAIDTILNDIKMTQGVEIDYESIKAVYDGKELPITDGENTFNVNAGTVEYNKPITITFDAIIKSNDLAGQTVYNEANITASNNTEVVTASKTVNVLKPVLAISKISDKEKYNVGDDIAYTIQVSQMIPDAKAINVLVKDSDITEGVKINTDSIKVDDENATVNVQDNNVEILIPEIQYGKVVTITYTAHVESSSLAGQDVINKASVNCDNNKEIIETEDKANIYKPQLEINKSVERKEYNVGDTVNYTIVARQTVDGAKARKAYIIDEIDEGMAINYASIKVETDSPYEIETTDSGFVIVIDSLDNTARITYSAKITSDSLVGKNVNNVVTATSDNNLENRPQDEETISVKKPELSIGKTADKDVYNTNENVNYTINVAQTVEGATAKKVYIKDMIQDGMIIDYDSITVESESGYTIERTENGFVVVLDSVSQNAKISYMAKVPNELAGEKVINAVEASCDNNPDTKPTDVSTIDIYKPELTVEKSADKENVNIGDTVTYTIKVNQTVENAKAFNVQVCDILDEGMSIDYSSITVNTEFGYDIVENKNGFIVILDELDNSATIAYNATVQSNDLAGTQAVNTVSASCDNNPDSNPEDKEEVTVLKPQLSIEKTSNKDLYAYKDTVEYTITIKQVVEGAVAQNVQINDFDISDGITIDMDSIQIEAEEGTNATVVKGDNAFGIKADKITNHLTVRFNATIDDINLTEKEITNKANATASNNTDVVETETTAKVGKPELNISIDTDKEFYNVNDIVRFDMKVSNTTPGLRAVNPIIKEFDMTQGVELDDASIQVKGLNPNQTYEIIKTETGFEIRMNYLDNGQDVHVLYNGLIADNQLANKTIEDFGEITCENNQEIKKAETNAPVKIPTFEITKTSDKETYNVYEEIEYTVTFRQKDKDAKAYDTVLNDTFINEGIDIDLNTISISGIDSSRCTITPSGNGYILSIDGYLTSDDVITVKYKGRLNSPELAGQKLSHNVYVSCSNNPEVERWEATIDSEVLKPLLEISKSTDKETYVVGDTVNYTVNVRQTVENAIAKDVLVTDVMDAGMKIDYDSITVDTDSLYTVEETENGFNLHLDSLADEINITYKAIVESQELSGKNVVNKASASCTNNPNTKPEVSHEIRIMEVVGMTEIIEQKPDNKDQGKVENTETPKPEQTQQTVKTSDSTNMMSGIVMAGVSICSLMLLRRFKKEVK